MCLSTSRQVGGNCDNNTSQPRNPQCFLRPQRGQGLVLRQRDASWGRGSWLQGHCQTAVWKHSQYRCESKQLYLSELKSELLVYFRSFGQYPEGSSVMGIYLVKLFTSAIWWCWNKPNECKLVLILGRGKVWMWTWTRQWPCLCDGLLKWTPKMMDFLNNWKYFEMMKSIFYSLSWMDSQWASFRIHLPRQRWLDVSWTFATTCQVLPVKTHFHKPL